MSSHALSHQAPLERQRPSRSSSRATLARALTASVGCDMMTVTVQAPVTLPDALLHAFPAQASVLWDPSCGPSFAGLGVSQLVQPTTQGAERFFKRFRQSGAQHLPRIFGGIAFCPGAADAAPWSSFGDGVLMLPRWIYEADDDASLCFSCEGSELDAGSIERVLGEFDHIWESLVAPMPELPPLTVRDTSKGDPDQWLEQVEAIRSQIRAGAVQKVVAARHTVVELDQPGEARVVLAQLRSRFPGCTRFAFWRKGSAFVGATPEFLVARHGAKVTTEALAGSVERGHGDELLGSAKERDEHQLVVDAILQALRPFCIELHSAPKPRIRELPDLLHMQTPIEARLLKDTHVLDLVEALHPTPAVGGVPTKEAVDWIAVHESGPRGWYSAPVGWVDERGDGEFAVALRSGLIQGSKVWVYAGAGVMRDSVPEAEYAETELKMQALLGAIHGAAQSTT